MPATTLPVTTWSNRWDALKAEIDDFLAQLPGLSIDREKTFRIMTRELKTFAQHHFFDIFYTNFRNGIFHIGRKGAANPEEYVHSIILDQVANDLNVIRQAAWQRKFGSPDMLSTLTLADGLAQASLDQFVNCFDVKPVSALTYFQKNPSIRVIPYVPVALIGIPQTSTRIRQDLLGIPHEIGHYLFWHSRIRVKINNKEKSMSIQKYLKGAIPKSPNYVYCWMEEIFADVIGCLIAETISADGCQVIQQQYELDAFYEDDNKHPAPVLRPHIYTKVLTLLKSNAAVVLDNNWQDYRRTQFAKYLQKWDINPTGQKECVRFKNGKEAPLEDLIGYEYTTAPGAIPQNVRYDVLDPDKPVDQLIKIFWDLLNFARSGWWLNAVNNTDYQNFSTYPDLIPASLPSVELFDYSDYPTRTETDYALPLNAAGEIEEEDWIKKIDYDGWVREGGGDNPRPK